MRLLHSSVLNSGFPYLCSPVEDHILSWFDRSRLTCIVVGLIHVPVCLVWRFRCVLVRSMIGLSHFPGYCSLLKSVQFCVKVMGPRSKGLNIFHVYSLGSQEVLLMVTSLIQALFSLQ